MDEMTKSMRVGVLERDKAKLESELALLRSLVGDRLEERGIAVRPEDVADVLRWASQPEAVRFLIGVGREDAEGLCLTCARTGPLHRPECKLFAALAALGDSRADAAIGAAFDAVRDQHDDEFGPENFPNGRLPDPPPGFFIQQRFDPLRGVRYRLVALQQEPLGVPACTHRVLEVGPDGAQCTDCGQLVPGVARRL